MGLACNVGIAVAWAWGQSRSEGNRENVRITKKEGRLKKVDTKK
jgi:hypothetical protein